MSLVRPILEYGAACWDPYREGQITTLDGAKEGGQICISYEQFELGNFGVIRHMCSRQSVLWRMGVEGCRRQITTATLSEQGRS